MRIPLVFTQDKLDDIERKLFSARIDLETRRLILYARVFSVVTAIFVVLIVYLFDMFIFTVGNLFSDPEFAIYTIPLTVLISIISGFAVYSAVISYPSFEMNTRKRQIDASMYDMVLYLYALHHSGAEMYAAIQSIAKFADYYGDAAKEFRQVVSDVEFCGYDPYTAITRLTETTPSTKFRFFLSEYASTFRSIGSVDLFLQDKVNEMRDEHRIAQKAYLSSLGAIAEMYITLFVAGPLFVVIVIMVLGLISGSDPLILGLVIYVMLPIGTIIFLLLLDTLGQEYQIERKDMELLAEKQYHDIEIVQTQRDEAPLFKKLEKHDKSAARRGFIAHPLTTIREKPGLSLIFSVPLAFIVAIFAYMFLVTEPFTAYTMTNWVRQFDDVVVLFALVIMIPFSYFYQKRRKRYLKIEESLPDFNRLLGSSVRHNMTLSRAIQMASEEGKSYIRDEIQMLHRDTEWGTKVSLAIQRFSTRLKLLAVDRMVILISETEHFTNNISNTLFLLYHEAKDSLALANERRSDMSVYVVIVYMAFAVFVFVQVIMAAVFLDIMMDAGSLSTSTASAGGVAIGGGFPAELYKIIITHSVLIHGVCSGLVAGKMGEGSLYAGIRHACVMLALGTITFFVVDMLTM